MDKEIPERLKCPICFGIPEKEVFQCKNGHAICHQCASSLLKCPQCRVVFEKPRIRCRAFEDLLDVMKFDCANKSDGCMVKVSRSEISNHIQCKFGGQFICLCEDLGFHCGFITNTQRLKEVMLHLRNTHNVLITSKADLEITYEVFQYKNPGMRKGKSGRGLAVVIDMQQEHGTIFIVLGRLNGEDHTFSLSCLEIAEQQNQSSASLFKAGFCIDAVNLSQRPNIEWSVKPVKPHYFGVITKEPIHRLPINILQKHYTQGKILLVKCSIFQHAEAQKPVVRQPQVHTEAEGPHSQTLNEHAPTAPNMPQDEVFRHSSRPRLPPPPPPPNNSGIETEGHKPKPKPRKAYSLQ